LQNTARKADVGLGLFNGGKVRVAEVQAVRSEWLH